MSVLSRGLLAALALAGSACASAPLPDTVPVPRSGQAGGDAHADHAAPDSHAQHAAPDSHAQHAAAPAPAMDHAAHAGHDMAAMAPVTIPDGSLITEADVRFMQHMIAHHAQAVYMTRLAETAGAGPRVLKLAQKIDLSQAGEIALMQDWLREYGQHVPDMDSWRGMRMAGMLTDEQLAALAAARGTDFDRLFLRQMIEHHEGAISMVHDLLASPRAAQEVDISVLANDVENTQLAEIELMWQMLAEIP
jgi:uncharacterized protein (DUF305 family)